MRPIWYWIAVAVSIVIWLGSCCGIPILLSLFGELDPKTTVTLYFVSPMFFVLPLVLIGGHLLGLETRGIFVGALVAFVALLAFVATPGEYKWAVPLVFAAVVGVILVWNLWRYPPQLRAAITQLKRGDKALALQLATQAIQARPRRWEAYQLRSTIQLLRGQLLDAERDAKAALKLKPNSHLCHSALGNAHLVQGNFVDAKASFAEALRLAPHYAMNHYNYGFACYRLGEHAAAVEALRVTARARLSFARDSLLAHYFLGRSLEALGQAIPAQTAYQAMARFGNGYEMLADELRDSPDFPNVVLLRADLMDIEQRLKRS